MKRVNISGDIFGETDPRNMPGRYFPGAIFKDYSTAVRGNPDKQNCTVCPRYWYFNAGFKCGRCGQEFTWTAAEQRRWFEDFKFWIDVSPSNCKKCRAELRRLESLRREYDADVASARSRGSVPQKRWIVEIINELEAEFGSMPEKILETRAEFLAQIAKAEHVETSEGDIPSC